MWHMYLLYIYILYIYIYIYIYIYSFIHFLYSHSFTISSRPQSPLGIFVSSFLKLFFVLKNKENKENTIGFKFFKKKT